MQGIAGFNLKYPDIYYIACLVVTPFFMLLYTFWSALDSVLENFSKDIIIK